MARLFIAAALIVATEGCIESPSTAMGERHPVVDISRDWIAVPAPTPSQELLDLRDALREARVDWEIGTLNGPPETTFGNPVDVAVQEGRVLVVDAMVNEIFIYSNEGEFIETFGREGRGPNEFRYLIHMSVTASGELLLGMTSGLKFFSRNDSSYELTTTRMVGESMPSPQDVCELDGRVYLRSSNLVDTEHTIFALTTTGDRESSFGSGYSKGSWLIRSELSAGFIACGSSPSRVISAFQYLPLVQGFSVDGQLQWTAHITNFSPLTWVSRMLDVGLTFGLDSREPGDMVLGLTALPRGAVIVQVVRLSGSRPERPGRQAIERLDTYLLSSETGEGVYIGEDLPRLLHADSSRLWAVSSAGQGVLKIVQLSYDSTAE